ncbi:MAG: acyl-CoA thioesterase [Candidatus Aminicenantes bacterium]|nr:acyl-CoA thioesterase [Candidatus Aminicenantes bacterium]
MSPSRRKYRFTLDFKVRDYECDRQGIVNNAVYQNYLEHCRHEFLLSVGIDFNRLSREHIFLVVVRAELNYKAPLHGGERFWIGLEMERLSPLRFAFLQDIYRSPDQRLILSARTIGTALNRNGRPCLPLELDVLLGPDGGPAADARGTVRGKPGNAPRSAPGDNPGS